MKMRLMNTLSVVLACGTLASMASAVDTVRATFNSVAPNTSCEFSADFGGTWKGTLAGGMNWTRDGVMPGSYAAACRVTSGPSASR